MYKTSFISITFELEVMLTASCISSNMIPNKKLGNFNNYNSFKKTHEN